MVTSGYSYCFVMLGAQGEVKSAAVYSALLAAIPVFPQRGKEKNQHRLRHGGLLLGSHLGQHRGLQQLAAGQGHAKHRRNILLLQKRCQLAILQIWAQFNLVGRNFALAHGGTLNLALEKHR